MAHRHIAILALLVALSPHLGVAALEAEEDPLQSEDEIRVRIYQTPLAPAPFTLVDHQRQAFGPSSLEGKWSIVFFGYTSCADICPTTLASLNAVHKRLPHRQDGNETQIVFVSIDPHRDTLPRLKEHVSFFNPAFLGVTGELKELVRFSASLGALFDYRERGTKKPIKNIDEYPQETDYLVGHVSDLFVFNPDGKLCGIIFPPHDPEHIMKAYKTLRSSATR